MQPPQISSLHLAQPTFPLCFHCRLLVGAPNAESGQPGVERAGAVYKCAAETPGSCELIPFDTKGKKMRKKSYTLEECVLGGRVRMGHCWMM